jgi:serine protease Do
LNIYNVKLSVCGKQVLRAVVVVFLLFGFSVVAQRLQAQPPSLAKASVADPPSGTMVPVPSELQGILTFGKVPQSLDQLRLLEQQFGRVSEAAKLCTVSVKIGQSQGCGVIIDGGGKVLTAAHVAMRPNKPATVILANGRRLKATTLGSNKNVDAGMLQINPD